MPATAQRFWPGADPIGKRMTVGVPLALTPDVDYATVVGIVGDVKHTSLSGDTGMQMYQPLYQAPGLGMTLVLRGKLDPTNLLDTIRGTVRTIDPTLPLANVKTMDTIIYENVAPFRFNMFLLPSRGSFVVRALTLAPLLTSCRTRSRLSRLPV